MGSFAKPFKSFRKKEELDKWEGFDSLKIKEGDSVEFAFDYEGTIFYTERQIEMNEGSKEKIDEGTRGTVIENMKTVVTVSLEDGSIIKGVPKLDLKRIK